MDKTKLRDSPCGGKCSHGKTAVYRFARSWAGVYVCYECGRKAPVRCYLRLIEEWGLDQ
jgi:hypothetical protein